MGLLGLWVRSGEECLEVEASWILLMAMTSQPTSGILTSRNSSTFFFFFFFPGSFVFLVLHHSIWRFPG